MGSGFAPSRELLRSGAVIPAHPLALTAARKLDERRQRALTRYYLAAGAGGIAVGVHTTQFAIRETKHGLYRPVLSLAAETVRDALKSNPRPVCMIAGLCGGTEQALAEARIARDFGYHAGLLNLGALPDVPDRQLIAHCQTISRTIPLFGFYLQPAAGGRELGYGFWRDFAEIENVWAIKVAPFDRYRTIDVVRAVIDAGRDDVALYIGNDDSIVNDLLMTVSQPVRGELRTRWFDGGLLGQWAVWTHSAVSLLAKTKAARATGTVDLELLRTGSALTDANGAIFDARHAFRGCIPGIHEVLRRQGLLDGTWCLDPAETLSPGQSAEISRVIRDYPFLTDDEFVARHLDSWLT